MRKFLLIILSLLFLLPHLGAQEYYKVRKNTRISTGMDEAAAVPYEDGVVYITESTSVGMSSPTDADGRRLFTMFQYKKNTGQKKQFIEALSTQRHEGPVSFTGDFKTMVFSQQRPSGTNRESDPLGLYFADNVDGNWVNVREFVFNSEQAWLFSPSFAPDGRTLFFAANFFGGEGGFDLYESKLKGGVWTEPENLGPAVNTPGNEIYPCMHESGRLVFSSEGHDDSKAGYDLFETVCMNGDWLGALKLSPPFNSLSNDYHVWFSKDQKAGYLTSDRQGGSKDIFEFETDIPSMDSVAAPIKKTYYKYKIKDRKLDTVDHNLFKYSWVINDTLEIPGHEIIYKFPGPGTYVCKLNVYDIQLDTLVEGQTVKTLRIRLNEQAVIVCPDTIRVNSTVEFDASQSYLPGFDVGRYVWDFGDGKFGQGEILQHTYNYPGRFKVILGVEERKRNRRHEPEVRANFKEVIVISE